MVMKKPQNYLLILIILIFKISEIKAIGLQQIAPPFEVYDFKMTQKYHSDNFHQHDLNLLIFWETYCEKCIQALKSVWEKSEQIKALSVNVVTINYNDPNNMFEAMEFSRQSPFPVFYDIDRMVVEAYGATYNEFFAFIINQEGRILYILDESLPDAGIVLINQLKYFKKKKDIKDTHNIYANKNTQPITSLPFSQIQVSGEARTRFLDVNASSPQAHGAYGEPLHEGSTYKYYFEPWITLSLHPNLQIGTLLRITNIPDQYLKGAPDYYTNTIFSPYIKFRLSNRISSTIGFYRMYLSPLTLMRWDEKDNPPGAGGTGGICGTCTMSPGAISTENLENLQPTIGFEGAHLNGLFSPSFHSKIFYARPFSADVKTNQNNQHLIGTQLTHRLWRNNTISLNYLYLFEQNDNSESSTSTLFLPPLKKDHLLSTIVNIFPLAFWNISGEFAYFQRRLSRIGSSIIYDLGKKEGMAYLIQSDIDLEIFRRFDLSLNTAYLSLDKDYNTMYKAISYVPNRQGFRFRSIISWHRMTFQLFHKSLKEIEPTNFQNQKLSVTLDGVGFQYQNTFKNFPIQTFLNYSIEKTKNNFTVSINGRNDRAIFNMGISIQLHERFSFFLNFYHVKEKFGTESSTSKYFAIYNFVEL